MWTMLDLGSPIIVPMLENINSRRQRNNGNERAILIKLFENSVFYFLQKI